MVSSLSEFNDRGNRQKTSGNFSDFQNSDKLYLEDTTLLQPTHFLNIELSSSQPNSTVLRSQGPRSFILLCNYWQALGKLLSSRFFGSFPLKVLAKHVSFLNITQAAEFKYLPVSTSSLSFSDTLCMSDKYHLGNSHALSRLRTVVLNKLRLGIAF